MKLRFILPILLCASAFGQTWFKVAPGDATVSIPAGTVMRYGAPAGTVNGCNASGAPLATAVWVTPTVASPTAVTIAALGIATDPAPCYNKELDVLETAVTQTVKVNGKTVTVPALPVVVATPLKPTVAGKYALSASPTNPLILTIYSDGSFTLTGGGLATKQ